MGQNCERFIGMCLESCKDADAIVYCDGGSTDKTKSIVMEYLDEKGIVGDNWKCIQQEYNQEDPKMNGKQRNFYLKYLKENYKDWYCLVLDADEVLEDVGIQKIRAIMMTEGVPNILSPRIHHFIGDLGHEDATQQEHFVFNRLFKITKDLFYPEVEHPVLHTKNNVSLKVNWVSIWHLRECLGVLETNKKFENNLKKSNMHSEKQLRQWNRDMLLGNYPRKRVHYDQLPTPTKKRFNI